MTGSASDSPSEFRGITVLPFLAAMALVLVPVSGFAQNPNCPPNGDPTCTAIWPGGDGTWFGRFWIYPGPPQVLGVPPSGSGVTAQISGGTVTLNLPVSLDAVNLAVGGSGTLLVSSPANTLTATQGMNVGYQAGGTGTLTIQTGGIVNTGFDAYLGTLSGATGIATVSDPGSQWNISRTSYIGDYGQGTLTISNGGQVNSVGTYLGFQPGSTGVVNVTGAGSQWNISGQSYIGDYGQGTLTISDAGQVNSSGAVYLGFQPGSSGSATVSGPGSQWNNSSALYVGLSGNGVLTISNGGVVNSTGDFSGIGANTGSFGSVLVTGAGSQWNNSAQLGIGPGGTLTISGGGVVNNAGGNAGGIFLRANGSATVTGAGSQWNTGFIEVGFDSAGALTIQNGGVVNSFNAGGGGFIGTFGGTGTVTVSGSGSQWNLPFLEVGSSDNGSLTIQNGGVVNGGATTIGTFSGSNGSATVSGVGSQLITSSLCVGCAGNGTLTISNGGQVNSSGPASLGFQPGSSGSATVSGPGSQWNSSNSLNVGLIGNGTLTISNGGVVSSVGGSIGANTGSFGSVLVTGAGSQWNNSGGVALLIGPGQGTLTISAGGVVNNPGGIFVRANAAATVTGAGSQLNTGFIEVGVGGAGALTIQNGGVVNTGTGFIGALGGSGVVVVTDAGSQWNNAGFNMQVGSGGTGSLTIQNGAVVNSGNGFIGSFAGDHGSATVTGAGSQWITSRFLTIGESGEGSLTVSNGGTVTDQNAIVGAGTGSGGNVLVDAATWTNTGDLTIGSVGTGCVTLQDHATLNAGSLTIGPHGCLIVDPSVVNVLGNFTLMPGGLLSLDIAGTTPDLFSQLNIGGFGLFQGTIDFDFINGFAPHAGDQFDLITALGGADFSQASFQILGLQPGFEYTDTFSGGHFILTALNDGVSTTGAPEPGTLLLLGLALFTMMAVSMQQSRLASRPRRV